MRIRWTPAAAADLQEHKRLPQRASPALSTAHHAEAVRDDTLIKAVAGPWTARPGEGKRRKDIDMPDQEQIVDRAGVGDDKLHSVRTPTAGGLRLRGGGRRQCNRGS